MKTNPKIDPSQNRLKRNYILEDEDGKVYEELVPETSSIDILPPDTQITFPFAVDPNFCPRCKSIHRINPRCLFHHKAGNIVIHETCPECGGKGSKNGDGGFKRGDFCWKCKGTGTVYQVTERRY